ncbi:MAG: 4Fe-4S dicluster domain-containing protein, partial [Bacteroidetes bacterium]|nr:4Fe-4S dicluster domain-containing protein [Bacteroidota bacterium]
IEKRCIANEIPILDPDVCIQCGKCAFVCPHAVIRLKAFDESEMANAPDTFKAMKARGKEFPAGTMMTVQVSPEDCTGCQLCVEVCPAKNKSNTSLKAINMLPIDDHLVAEKANWDFFLNLPEFDRNLVNKDTIKGSQVLQPLFEFSGACSGCGETPYIKLVTQLFGDRMLVANATGCSSIYGGNLPTTPYTKNKDGRGPAWSNSLFEDNAEFGLGYRIAVDMKKLQAENLLKKHTELLGAELVADVLNAIQTDEVGITAQRERVVKVKEILSSVNTNDAKRLIALSDFLVKKSVWIFGGDGWAYDIGYGGLDHVMASGRNVNILVMDTEVYSNTGGQMSKATPLGAVAKFAAGGKPNAKKDLALQAVQYGNVYVARIAMGAKDVQTLKAIQEAEAYDGPSLIIAYSHCIAHGIDMKNGLTQQKLAVESGYWPLFRYNPSLILEGKNPFQLESKAPAIPFEEYAMRETRYAMLHKFDPAHAKDLMKQAQKQVKDHWRIYENTVQLFEPKTEEHN